MCLCFFNLHKNKNKTNNIRYFKGSLSICFVFVIGFTKCFILYLRLFFEVLDIV